MATNPTAASAPDAIVHAAIVADIAFRHAPTSVFPTAPATGGNAGVTDVDRSAPRAPAFNRAADKIDRDQDRRTPAASAAPIDIRRAASVIVERIHGPRPVTRAPFCSDSLPGGTKQQQRTACLNALNSASAASAWDRRVLLLTRAIATSKGVIK